MGCCNVRDHLHTYIDGTSPSTVEFCTHAEHSAHEPAEAVSIQIPYILYVSRLASPPACKEAGPCCSALPQYAAEGVEGPLVVFRIYEPSSSLTLSFFFFIFFFFFFFVFIFFVFALVPTTRRPSCFGRVRCLRWPLVDARWELSLWGDGSNPNRADDARPMGGYPTIYIQRHSETVQLGTCQQCGGAAWGSGVK